MKCCYKVDRFWTTYFVIRLFYLLFSVLIYSKLTTLGDTASYLSSGLNFSYEIFTNSTAFMCFLGGISGSFLGGVNILSNFPFTLYSFWIIRWTVQKLELRKYISSNLLMILLSLPNFCIWTSVCSKELAGLTFSAVYAVLVVNFLKGDYKIRWRDIGATYLCLLFKPQYFPFVFQGLLYIYIARQWCRSHRSQVFLGLMIVAADCLLLYHFRELVDLYAGMMYVHFDLAAAESTRDNIFLTAGDFFRHLPSGMFIGFFGPTLGEMMEKPLFLIAGLESSIILLLFLFLAGKFVARFFLLGRINVILFFSYFSIITGICLIHYPFGIFNPGSAIRYRTNFLFLFVIMFMYLYTSFRKERQYS